MAATDNEDSTTEKQSEQESSTLVAVLTIVWKLASIRETAYFKS